MWRQHLLHVKQFGTGDYFSDLDQEMAEATQIFCNNISTIVIAKIPILYG